MNMFFLLNRLFTLLRKPRPEGIYSEIFKSYLGRYPVILYDYFKTEKSYVHFHYYNTERGGEELDFSINPKKLDESHLILKCKLLNDQKFIISNIIFDGGNRFDKYIFQENTGYLNNWMEKFIIRQLKRLNSSEYISRKFYFNKENLLTIEDYELALRVAILRNT